MNKFKQEFANMKKTYLAFDLGASSGRAILGELNDGKLSLTEVHRFANGPTEIGGSLYWDFNAIGGEIKAGLKKALAKTKDISSIAIDTWGVDYVLLKDDGALARLPYNYRDSRTDGIPEKVFSIIPEKELYARAGIQFMQLNTIYQLMAHKETHPEDFKGSTLLFIPDALTYLLCGKKACEYSEASTSNLLDASKRDWDFELIKKLGIPTSVFPPIESPCTKAAPLTEAIQKELGCGPIPVVHAGSHDTASAVASVPAPVDKKWAYVSCGTWALLGAEIDAPILTETARQAAFTNEGGLCEKIRFLTNIMGAWLFQETKRVWTEEGKNPTYPKMEEVARNTPRLKFLINPNDQRFFTPGNMPQNIKDSCRESGQGKVSEDAEVLRCIYDSLALCFRAKLEKLQETLGVKYECLNIVGGATQDHLLMQLAADAIGIPVVAGPIEATSIGNIAAQAMADGDIASLADAREMVKNSFEVIEFAPDDASKADWDKAYEKFIKLS